MPLQEIVTFNDNRRNLIYKHYEQVAWFSFFIDSNKSLVLKPVITRTNDMSTEKQNK